MPASEGTVFQGSANWNSKAFLFSNPHTFKCKHMFNGYGAAREQSLKRLFDIIGVDVSKGGDVALLRADNDFYPRDGGSADGSFGLRVSTKNVSAVNAFTKGDMLKDIECQFEGRAEARAHTLTIGVSAGLVIDDVSMSGQHGAESSTAQLGIEAIIPVDAGGTGLGSGVGPYAHPWLMRVVSDNDRDEDWTPVAVTIPS
ncbi:MAG: hypothetical protein BWY95_00184 [Bacteroidetes bacterium ADurb.BinA104]|nr:MAG: hypothetical protein BWY95_00184 [Bacteroidetes bacterium ADurb.BinA104]